MINANDFNQTNIPEEEPSIDIRQYVALFMQWWWLILLAGILAGAGAYFFSQQMTPLYQSSTTLLINEAPSLAKTDYNSLITNERLAQTYAVLMTKRPVMEKVIQRLGIRITPDELAGMITVAPVRDTQLLVVTVESDNPELSAIVANATVLVFGEQVEETQKSRFSSSEENLKKQISDMEAQMLQVRNALETTTDKDERDRLEARQNQYDQIYANLVVSYEQVRLTEAQSSSSVMQVEQALPNWIPVKPNIPMNTLLAAVIGFMLAVGGVFLYDALDDTVKTPDEISRKLQLNVLGTIARFDAPKGSELVALVQPRSPITESFRALRTNVQYASVDRPLRTLLVTSANQGDGKTTVISNLAVVMAQSGRRVTLMDADLHRPRAYKLFQANSRPGLSTLFVQPRLHLNGSLQQTVMDQLRVIGPGELPPNPAELLGSNKMREILDTVGQQSDLTLLDTPPILLLTDGLALAPMVDGVLLVVKPGETKMAMLRQTVEQLRAVGARVIGVVLNGVDQRRGRYGYYYKNYYYGSYQAEGQKKKVKLEVSKVKEIV